MSRSKSLYWFVAAFVCQIIFITDTLVMGGGKNVHWWFWIFAVASVLLAGVATWVVLKEEEAELKKRFPLSEDE